MAASASGHPSTEEGPPLPAVTYAPLLKQPKKPLKSFNQADHVPTWGPQVIWEQAEVDQMIINENLEYAIIGKFSYKWPEIQELQRLIPKQCELKAECKIGLLCNRHILIRASLMEDYVYLLSKPTFYITQRSSSYPMRMFK